MSTIGELIGPKKMTKPKKNFIHENMRRLREVQVMNKQTTGTAQNLKRSAHAVSKAEAVESVTNKKKDKILGTKVGQENSDPDCEKFTRLVIRHVPTPSTTLSSHRTSKAYRNQETQTVEPEDFDSLHHDGVIRYPSTCLREGTEDSSKKKMVREMGQQTELSPHDRGDILLSEDEDEFSYIDSKGTIDYVKLNAMVVPKPKAAQPPKKDPIRAPPSYQRGILPKYLRELKKEHTKEMEEKEREAEAADPDCPPGHTPMPNDVRLEHLKILKQNYSELVSQLNKLPVRSDTLRTRLRKREMETELDKIEAAMSIFSREKVYIKPNVAQA